MVKNNLTVVTFLSTVSFRLPQPGGPWQAGAGGLSTCFDYSICLCMFACCLLSEVPVLCLIDWFLFVDARRQGVTQVVCEYPFEATGNRFNLSHHPKGYFSIQTLEQQLASNEVLEHSFGQETGDSCGIRVRSAFLASQLIWRYQGNS